MLLFNREPHHSQKHLIRKIWWVHSSLSWRESVSARGSWMALCFWKSNILIGLHFRHVLDVWHIVWLLMHHIKVNTRINQEYLLNIFMLHLEQVYSSEWLRRSEKQLSLISAISSLSMWLASSAVEQGVLVCLAHFFYCFYKLQDLQTLQYSW